MPSPLHEWLLNIPQAQFIASSLVIFRQHMANKTDGFHIMDHVTAKDALIASLVAVCDELNKEGSTDAEGKFIPRYQSIVGRPVEFSDILEAYGHSWESFSVELKP